MMTEDELLKGIRAGLIGWYDFTPDSKVLCLGKNREEITEYLQGKGLLVECTHIGDIFNHDLQREKHDGYDYIISVGDLELTKAPKDFLLFLRKMMKPQGKLLLGLNNRLGIRYFCGDRDPYTKQNFDGIENYRRVYENDGSFQGKMYARAELESILDDSGFEKYKFYSVLSDLDNPAFIFADNYLPNEDMVNRLHPTYNSPETVFLEEEWLYGTLAQNNMFHKMANAFLIECSFSGDVSDVLHATISMERGRENAIFTIIRDSGTVEKKAAFPDGIKRLKQLADNMDELKQRGISTVAGRLQHGSFIMPFIKKDVGQLYLEKLFFSDYEKFLEAMDEFRDAIMHSSDIVEPDKGDGEGALLARGYWDMVPLNTFYTERGFTFFDQEFCLEPCPVNFIIYRMISTFFQPSYERVISVDELFKRYGLDKCLEKWQQMENDHITWLRKGKELSKYNAKHNRNMAVVNDNRQRINYPFEKYQRMFVDIFHNAAHRKLILFGSGKFARKFMTIYKADYPVYKIIDNNSARWGQKLDGVEIVSSDILRELGHGEYKVIICIKNYAFVAKQLEDMGVMDYSIYDVNRAYPHQKMPVVQVEKKEEKPKRFHIGYVAGVFDLFHYGHLNILRRAKDQCDYLIVGVVSDRQVREYKKVEPFVPFEERVEIVRSCRYVDEAHEIPFGHSDTDDAWRLYHFDVQFSGSDYEDDPVWLGKKKWLEERGSTMVFLPYTQSTSSTKLKKLITERLI